MMASAFGGFSWKQTTLHSVGLISFEEDIQYLGISCHYSFDLFLHF